MTPTPDRVTTQQAADMLGVHHTTVVRFIRNGQMPAWRIGRAYKVDRAVVENFAQSTVSAK